MVSVKGICNSALVLSAIILFVLLRILQRVGITLIHWFQCGNEFWVVNERKIIPPCLQDETLGRHEFAQLKNLRLHYVENGDRRKPFMLFIHGFPEFWYTWKNQIKYFSKTHWVVALDMRGYGESDRPTKLADYRMENLEKDVYEFIQLYGKSKCILVAHDWGAPICYYLSSKHPELFDQLIILNGCHPKVFKKLLLENVTSQIWKSWYMFVFQIPYIPEHVIYHSGDLDVIDGLCKFKNKYFVSASDVEALKYPFSRKECWTAGINYYRCGLWKNGKLNPDDNMANIKVPTCIIWGDEDEFFIKGLPELTQPFIDDLTIHHIPEGHHCIQWHKPQIVNRLIEQFISKD